MCSQRAILANKNTHLVIMDIFYRTRIVYCVQVLTTQRRHNHVPLLVLLRTVPVHALQTLELKHVPVNTPVAQMEVVLAVHHGARVLDVEHQT